MNFKELNNKNFSENFKTIVKEERRITSEVLLYFREAEKRMLYAELGYSSLLTFAVQELKYSEAAAYRRISAMRLMREVPEVQEKIQTGELTLSTLTQASTFVRQSEKQFKEKITTSEKREILKAIEGKSSKETEITLLQINPELKPIIEEKQRIQANGATQVTTTLDAELVKQLEEIQVLLGKKMQIRDLLKYLAQEQLQILRKKSRRDAKAMTKAKITTNSIKVCANPKNKRAFISVKIKREILNQAQYQCCYVDPLSKRRCEEKHHLQTEHKTPKAFGGSDDLDNLEILCATHNKLRAVQKLGLKTMKNFMPSLR